MLSGVGRMFHGNQISFNTIQHHSTGWLRIGTMLNSTILNFGNGNVPSFPEPKGTNCDLVCVSRKPRNFEGQFRSL